MDEKFRVANVLTKSRIVYIDELTKHINKTQALPKKACLNNHSTRARIKRTYITKPRKRGS